MINLSDRQISFLQEEFDIKQSDLESISREDWKQVREAAFMIESNEYDIPDQEKVSLKGIIASEIADITYSDIHKDKTI